MGSGGRTRLFHGVYFSMLLEAGDYRPFFYLSGAVAAEAIVAATLWQAARRVPFKRGMASILLVIGLGWFLDTMRN